MREFLTASVLCAALFALPACEATKAGASGALNAAPDSALKRGKQLLDNPTPGGLVGAALGFIADITEAGMKAVDEHKGKISVGALAAAAAGLHVRKRRKAKKNKEEPK